MSWWYFLDDSLLLDEQWEDGCWLHNNAFNVVSYLTPFPMQFISMVSFFSPGFYSVAKIVGTSFKCFSRRLLESLSEVFALVLLQDGDVVAPCNRSCEVGTHCVGKVWVVRWWWVSMSCWLSVLTQGPNCTQRRSILIIGKLPIIPTQFLLTSTRWEVALLCTLRWHGIGMCRCCTHAIVALQAMPFPFQVLP